MSIILGGAAAATTGERDPFFSDVVLLMNNAVTDLSNNNTSITFNNTTLNSMTLPDGSTGNAIQLDAGDYFTTADAIPGFGTSNFTVEFYVNYFNAINNNAQHDVRIGNAQIGIPLLWLNQGRPYLAAGTSTTGSDSARIIASSALSENQWYHLAITRDGTTHRLYVDGVVQGSWNSSSVLNFNETHGLQFNRRYSGTTYADDYYLCNLRLTYGTARYGGSNFTPETAPWPTR
jgi:hypothetical protein